MATLGVFAIIFDPPHRVLCVRTSYGVQRWTTPGGRVEAHESPLQALQREVLEETGLVIRPGALIGAYAKPYEDDLVLSFTAEIIEHRNWEPDAEIAETGFFSVQELPQPMTLIARTRILDGFKNHRGVYRVFETPAEGSGIDTTRPDIAPAK